MNSLRNQLKCPCQSGCPTGCPCDEYECLGMEPNPCDEIQCNNDGVCQDGKCDCAQTGKTDDIWLSNILQSAKMCTLQPLLQGCVQLRYQN